MKICAQLVLAILIGCMFTSAIERSASAQVFELKMDDQDGAENQERRGGYIHQFLNNRSGEKGFFGFIKWSFPMRNGPTCTGSCEM